MHDLELFFWMLLFIKLSQVKVGRITDFGC